MRLPLLLCLLTGLFVSADEWLQPRVIADTTRQSDWQGTLRDDGIRHHDKPTQRWEQRRTATIRLPSAPHDWTTHTHLRFWLYSHVNTNTHFILHLSAENPAHEGADYYHTFIKVNFTGWREFVIPIRSLTPARKPLPKSQIGAVSLHADGWHNKLDPRTTLNISDIEFGNLRKTMMTNAQLFDALDLTLPGLEKAHEAWQRRDEAETARLVAAYFRNRTSVPWTFDPHDPNLTFTGNRQAADATVRGKVTVVCVDHTYPNGDIDWLYNRTLDDPKLPNNHEWLWQLNRMSFWHNLGRVYRMTGDETYAKTFVKHLRSWTEQCPDPRTNAANVPGSAWRTIECGIRLLSSWPDAYHLFLHSPSFSDQDLLLFIRSAVEQMRHLIAFPQSGNWLTMEMNGVYTCAALFPELRESAAARKIAIDKIYADIARQFLPDGAQFELTPGYHQVALDNVMALPNKARLFNRLDEIPTDFVKLMEKAYDFNLRLMLPNGSLPQYNDSWECNVPRSLAAALQHFPDRQDFRFIASGGKKGTQPSFTSTLLPWAGYAALRSDWSPNATYVGFDAGPLGYGHYHQDKLNLVLYSGKHELIFDDGGGCYENSPFRRYATSAFGHNTILVDGLSQQRNARDLAQRVLQQPLDIPWLSTPDFDFVAASYAEGYGKPDHKPATHTRQLLLLKPSLLLVCDILQPNDDQPHTYQQRWQINDPSVTTFIPDHPALISASPNRKRVVVAPLLTDGLQATHASAQTSPEVLGWYVIKDKGPYRPATTACFSRQGAGTQLFLTLLAPVDDQDDAPITDIRQLSPTQAAITLRDGRTLQVTAPTTPNEPLTFKLTPHTQP